MEDLLSSDTVVIGVGNTILSDEGVGVHAARLLQSDPRVPAGVTILDGGTIGLELIPYASDASRVLLLDAMNSGEAPGTLARMTGTRFARHDGGMERSSIGRCGSDRGSFPGIEPSSGHCCAGRAASQHGLGHIFVSRSRGRADAIGRCSVGAAATLEWLAGRC